MHTCIKKILTSGTKRKFAYKYFVDLGRSLITTSIETLWKSIMVCVWGGGGGGGCLLHPHNGFQFCWYIQKLFQMNWQICHIALSSRNAWKTEETTGPNTERVIVKWGKQACCCIAQCTIKYIFQAIIHTIGNQQNQPLSHIIDCKRASRNADEIQACSNSQHLVGHSRNYV